MEKLSLYDTLKWPRNGHGFINDMKKSLKNHYNFPEFFFVHLSLRLLGFNCRYLECLSSHPNENFPWFIDILCLSRMKFLFKSLRFISKLTPCLIFKVSLTERVILFTFENPSVNFKVNLVHSLNTGSWHQSEQIELQIFCRH
jgi:hypothetical protein